MKKIILMTLAIITIAGLTTEVTAQYSARVSQTATANLVATIGMASDVPLNFGIMSIPTSDVDVTLSTAHLVTTSDATKISLFPTTATNAHYTVSGTALYAYSITLPTAGSITIANGASSMHIEDFRALTASVPGANGTTGTLNVSGQDTFVVGATLKVKSTLITGAYTGSFDVLVAYN